jgi:transposase-like protein
MAREKIAAVRLSADEKARLRSVAAGYGLTEAGLLKRAVDRLIDPAGLSARGHLEVPPDGARLAKMLICLHPDTRGPLAERARARGLAPATYAAAVLRSHVLNLRPLPKAEIKAFEQGVVQLSLIGRNLNQLTRRANADNAVAVPRREDLALFLKTCTSMLEHLKVALKANKESWEVGYEPGDR